MIEHLNFVWSVLTNDTSQTIWLIWLTIVMMLDSFDEKYKGGTAKWVKGRD